MKLIFIYTGILLLLYIQVTAQTADSSHYFYLKATEAKSGRLFMATYQDFKQALESDPKNPGILRQLGETEVELRKYEEVDMNNYKPAIPYFQKAIALDPSLKSLKTEIRIEQ
jgi:tetratricopeptide (TPR) repeat protein